MHADKVCALLAHGHDAVCIGVKRSIMVTAIRLPNAEFVTSLPAGFVMQRSEVLLDLSWVQLYAVKAQSIMTVGDWNLTLMSARQASSTHITTWQNFGATGGGLHTPPWTVVDEIRVFGCPLSTSSESLFARSVSLGIVSAGPTRVAGCSCFHIDCRLPIGSEVSQFE